MNTSGEVLTNEVKATDVRFSGSDLVMTLSDGRVLSVPMDKVEWLHWLAQATPEQRRHWHIEPGGFAVYWDDLDDGVEVSHLLASVSLV
ncbi:MAG: DUF2442 domain-containing protein [Chloroflexi bacterium]|nr:DUF2442 domain-containing protein [Chloroflexota bacterium]MCL5275284.1 DUF2442 domain-containing protein [Chloroflexota bacterium]